MKSAVVYLRRLAAWFWQGCHLFSGPLIAIVPPLLIAQLWPDELGFRIVGFALQVLGAWIVWVGIRGTRKQFEVPGSWVQVKAWWSSYPRLRGRGVHVSVVAAEVRLDGMSARAYVWSGVPEDATLEERIGAAEKNLERVREDLSAHQQEADQRDRAQKDEMKRERAEREAADQAIHDEIKKTETGGLHLNAAGVWWLISGTVCSTFPEEIADLVAWMRT